MKISSDSGVTRSVWMDEQSFDPHSLLAPETRTDVCIVGAGIAGLTTAYELLKVGRNVVVLDDGPIGGGETGRTTAHLTYAMDDGFRRLERVHGDAALRTIVESHRGAIDVIQRNVEELGIDCGFRRVDGYLFASDDHPTRDLADELETALRAGAEVYPCERAPLPFETGPCLRFAGQAEFHPLAYLNGLARAICARGGMIHLGVHVEQIAPGDPMKISAAGGRTVFARAVVDATNATITSSMKIPLRQAPYRTYAIAFSVPRGAIARHLAWDTADPYHYIRLADDGDSELLIVGGEDHRTGQDDEPGARWEALENWTRARIPIAGPIRTRWSGQVMEPADGLAFIGKSPDVDGVYIVSGDSGQGMTHGTIAGVVLAELLEGREHPWAEIYSPQRSVFRGFGELLREAVHSGAPYADWFKPSEVESADDLMPGDGALVRRGLRMIAAYRDLDGVLHERSAVCPHLAGVVAWNAAEKTWDCPCHGSRFDAYGKVVNGPAIGDLERVEREKSERVPLRVDRPRVRKA
jgi:glycine/D-amino acid oxidase-like deaminating enzyme/nitrite reductase/ring-hydroxylating ferredoxin subunit